MRSWDSPRFFLVSVSYQSDLRCEQSGNLGLSLSYPLPPGGRDVHCTEV